MIQEESRGVMGSHDKSSGELVLAASVRYHGTNCPLLTVFFSFSFFLSSLFFCLGYISPRMGYRRVLKFCVGF